MPLMAALLPFNCLKATLQHTAHTPFLTLSHRLSLSVSLFQILSLIVTREWREKRGRVGER